MTWAGGRRFFIVSLIAALVIFVMALAAVATFYNAPSCSDLKQNQGENGIDCGGPCAYLCTALQQAPVVRFTKVLLPVDNRIDIVAYIDNPNVGAAARAVPYKVTLYAADHTILKTEIGTLDLPPARSVPVFLPAFFTGSASSTQAFLTIDTSKIKWFTYTKPIRVPTVENPSIEGTSIAPRVTATLSNADVVSFTDVQVVAMIYDSNDTVIAASQTLLPNIAGQGSAPTTFTWGRAFPGVPARIEVVPVPLLPL